MSEGVTLDSIAEQLLCVQSDLAWIRGHLSAQTEILLRLEKIQIRNLESRVRALEEKTR